VDAGCEGERQEILMTTIWPSRRLSGLPDLWCGDGSRHSDVRGAGTYL